jgi:hypothetical protein
LYNAFVFFFCFWKDMQDSGQLKLVPGWAQTLAHAVLGSGVRYGYVVNETELNEAFPALAAMDQDAKDALLAQAVDFNKSAEDGWVWEEPFPEKWKDTVSGFSGQAVLWLLAHGAKPSRIPFGDRPLHYFYYTVPCWGSALSGMCALIQEGDGTEFHPNQLRQFLGCELATASAPGRMWEQVLRMCPGMLLP